MVAKMPYQSLNHSLALLKKQVLSGIPYAVKELPKFDTPEQIFSWFKERIKYKSDPQGVELFQSLPTFFKNNYWGKDKSGYGDCDCFTIAILTVLLANGFYNCGIVLVGRNKKNAVHIYAYVDDNGRRKYMDLTNKYFNSERDYSHRQEIKFNLTNQEKKQIENMTLQLADQGAANVNNFANHLFLPSKGVFIREDMADNMPFDEFTRGLTEEGYNPFQIAELAAKRQERKAEKKSAKVQTKTDRKGAKTEKKTTRTATKATKKTSRADSKSNRKEKRADRERMSPEQKSAITSKLIKVGSGVISKYTGAEIPNTDTPESERPIDNIRTIAPGATTPGATDTEDKILGMPKKVAVGLGIGILILGVGAAVMKSKKTA